MSGTSNDALALRRRVTGQQPVNGRVLVHLHRQVRDVLAEDAVHRREDDLLVRAVSHTHVQTTNDDVWGLRPVVLVGALEDTIDGRDLGMGAGLRGASIPHSVHYTYGIATTTSLCTHDEPGPTSRRHRSSDVFRFAGRTCAKTRPVA